MKNIKMLMIVMLLPALLVSCFDKEEDVLVPYGKKGAVIPSVSNLFPATFDSNDLDNTFVAFDVDAEASEGYVEVSIQGQYERVKYIDIASFPASVEVSLKGVAEALGVSVNDIELGTVVSIEVVVKSPNDGSFYRSTEVVSPALVCGYNADLASGAYNGWSDDWAVDGDITITVDEVDPYVVYVSGLAALDGLVEDGGPLKMIIDPNDYSVTAVETILASDAWGYTNFKYSGTGKLNTCDGTYNMSFDISVDQGGWGSNVFVLTKK